MKTLFYAAILALGVGPLLPATQAKAQEPFVGQVTYFAGNFAPRGWAFCDGQLLAISQNDALFSVLGTTYGGDGVNSFALPDMRGRILMHAGSGPGLTPRRLGEKGGSEEITLTLPELASHAHTASLKASSAGADGTSASGALFGQSMVDMYLENASSLDETLSRLSLVSMNAGGNRAHENRMPFNTARCIIALYGVYPSRN
jgi:microcystin-dependent protein